MVGREIGGWVEEGKTGCVLSLYKTEVVCHFSSKTFQKQAFAINQQLTSNVK